MTWKMVILLAGLISLVCVGCAQREAKPTLPEPMRLAPKARAAPQFKPVAGSTEAVQEAALATQSLPQLRAHLEIRTILVQAGQPVSVPMVHEGILELRAGSVATIVDGKRQQRQRGEMWQVAKGSRVTLQASGELAVLRAIYLVAGEK